LIGPQPITRKRTLHILAGSCASLLFPSYSLSAGEDTKYSWSGVALGGEVQIDLYHSNKHHAAKLIKTCVAEIDRLEQEFSLYRPSSSVVKLNTAGRLRNPSHDLLKLLSESHRISLISGGAFDVSVQPLWQLYASHFAENPRSEYGPDKTQIERVLRSVGFQNIHYSAQEISFSKPGMALTFNGIAQGYITDRIADMLRGGGLRNVLINLGEIRALGGNSRPHVPWRIGIKSPTIKGKTVHRINLVDKAVATSASSGTSFDQSGNYHHLFSPADGNNSTRFGSISVIDNHATTADGLSTAFSVMRLEDIRKIVLASENMSVVVVDQNNQIIEI
jgi:FAD:protein FMN transferase